MKANEIQIGDWLYSVIDRYDHIEKKLCKVTGIRTDSDVPFIRCNDTDVWYSLESYEPVQLIAEILEKNGFRKRKWESNSYVNSESEAAYICFSIGDYTNFWGGGDQDYVWVTVKYVHQLQHALRLCGIEKTIEL